MSSFPPQRVALLGFGRIGRRLARLGPPPCAVLVRPAQADEAADLLPGTRIATSLDQVLETRPDIVVEAAGTALLRSAALPVLAAGAELLPLSLVAFADDAFRAAVFAAAAAGPGRLVIPPGAIGSLDALGAAREAGLSAVTYRSVQPPRTYRRSAIAARFDLDALSAPTEVFAGTAREAAAAFPHNCNVAIGVALAGLGLDRTRVEMAADPAAVRNVHGVLFACDAGDGRIEMAVRVLPPDGDPADLTTFSVLRLLRRWRDPLFV